jgi:pyridoxamine 5'-phosphate oxidase
MDVPPSDWPDLLRDDVARLDRPPIAQLATVAPDGAPRVRSVVVRGLDASGAPWFASDARSLKFRGPDEVELCLWLPLASLQWRLAGRRVVHGPAAAGTWTERRREAWRLADPQVRAHLAGPAPGTPLSDAPHPPPATPGPDAAPPDAFVAVSLDLDRCERLHLGEPHRRWSWLRVEHGWRTRRLAP